MPKMAKVGEPSTQLTAAAAHSTARSICKDTMSCISVAPEPLPDQEPRIQTRRSSSSASVAFPQAIRKPFSHDSSPAVQSGPPVPQLRVPSTLSCINTKRRVLYIPYTSRPKVFGPRFFCTFSPPRCHNQRPPTPVPVHPCHLIPGIHPLLCCLRGLAPRISSCSSTKVLGQFYCSSAVLLQFYMQF